MKHLFIALFFITNTAAFAQTQHKLVPHYLQLTARAFSENDIEVTNLKEPKWQAGYNDTCINFDTINTVIKTVRSPIFVLNVLARDGWSLVSTTTVLNNTCIVYYLKKDFEH